MSTVSSVSCVKQTTLRNVMCVMRVSHATHVRVVTRVRFVLLVKKHIRYELMEVVWYGEKVCELFHVPSMLLL